MNFDKLDKLKAKIGALRPFPEAAVRIIHEKLLHSWIYNSISMNGNTLKANEIKIILEGKKVQGKSLREHFEVINHRDAIIYIEMLAKNNVSVSEPLIKRFHHILSKNIDDTNAGKYRDININFTESDHEPPHFSTMIDEMARLIVCHNENSIKMHPVELAARIHADLIKVHPFIDGNGRTARLLMNLELIKSDFPPAVIPANLKKEYFATLDKAHMQNDYEPFIRLVADASEKSLIIYLNALGIK